MNILMEQENRILQDYFPMKQHVVDIIHALDWLIVFQRKQTARLRKLKGYFCAQLSLFERAETDKFYKK